MKIPSDNIGSTLLKPLDAESLGALEQGRLGLGPLADGGALAPAEATPAEALAPTRDPGETLLGSDVWNGAADGARRLDLMPGAVSAAGGSAALDQAVDTILAGLR
ncbi:MAG TPA: hypothetical protein PKO41_00580 [Dokdonella sp.]|uniref:hypothetical protein n=1 Tax=Dokdonella sp. TaxID=2291710 RepID=UPI0025C154A7|nr:hypothetical protein [Dokdonella sp.]MBX3691596.1 hypothetical protein [Dokdonella sp.]MCW5567698.1 hypothetical protein [Dokdonella sp.]HNR90894.1 hypothetical protein [Dokdonella sp.]